MTFPGNTREYNYNYPFNNATNYLGFFFRIFVMVTLALRRIPYVKLGSRTAATDVPVVRVIPGTSVKVITYQLVKPLSDWPLTKKRNMAYFLKIIHLTRKRV